MMNPKKKNPLHSGWWMLFAFIGLLCSQNTWAQSFPEGFNYQAVLRDPAGNLIHSQNVTLRIGILSGTINGTLEHEETFSISTDAYGYVNIVVGQGTSTGMGQVAFDAIHWGSSDHFIHIELDINNNGIYTDAGTTQFYTVPYAMHSKTSDQQYSLSTLSDVDTADLQTGCTLTWNGTHWVAGTLVTASDSVLYAVTTATSAYADTAFVALNAINIGACDTATFALNADAAVYAAGADTALVANHAIYSDTAVYAWNVANKWSLNGDSIGGSEVLGTTNNADFSLISNNAERMRITSDGRVGIGTADPEASLHVVGNEGFMVTGTLGAGTARDFTGPRFVWYPRKAHLYSGTGGFLDDSRMGNYSFGSGDRVRPSGDCSVALGRITWADGEASFAGGYDSRALGDYSIAYGDVSQAHGECGVALGRDARANGTAAVALGYHPHATGAYSVAMGYQCRASDSSSWALGHQARSTHKGAFVWNDQSGGVLYSTAENQFLARASGGFNFYTHSDNLTGVELASGAGAWSTVSDSTQKEHFETLDYQEVLRKLQSIEVSEWNYIAQADSIRHVGPMAQDFYAAYGLGHNETSITTTDIDGVNLAAIKALAEQSKVLEAKANELEIMRQKQTELLHRIDRLEALLIQGRNGDLQSKR